MTYEHLLLDIQDHIGVIKLNRPEVLNAMNRRLFSEIDQAVTQLENDDDVHAIIFTGAGERAFSAGADIHEMAEQAKSDNPPPPDPRRAEYSWHLATARKPTIGALNGLAYGGGAVLASSLDIRVGCERTRFRFLAVQYGRVNSTWSLPQQVGWPLAKELLFTARVVEAEEAYPHRTPESPRTRRAVDGQGDGAREPHRGERPQDGAGGQGPPDPGHRRRVEIALPERAGRPGGEASADSGAGRLQAILGQKGTELKI